MFRRLDDARGADVEIWLDGESVRVPEGISLAAALLLLAPPPYRLSVVGGVPRAPFCMMGSCFECLVEIDGRRNRRACQVSVTPGMRIRRQIEAPENRLADEN